MQSRSSLNHVYRTVWNQALGAMVAVAEVASGSHGGSAPSSGRQPPIVPPAGGSPRGTLALAIALGWTCLSPVHANPTGPVVVQGQASFVTTGNTLTVTTQNAIGTNQSATNWQSFSIPAGSVTRIEQPNISSLSINRVVTNTPSLLLGNLSSNGQVVLVNQSGIAVGAGSVVDTARFTASTLAMSDQDVAAGRLRFGGANVGTGAVTVQGNIIARGGDVVLIAPNVEVAQTAVLQAPGGSVILAAGQSVEVTGRGLEGISMQVQAPSDQAINLGTLRGDAVGIFASTLKHSGVIDATTASLEGGRVVLKAQGDAFVQGDGKILATGAVGKGGHIELLGNRVAVTDRAVLDASGASGGGVVLVGGDYQGKNTAVQNAMVTYLGADAMVMADATDKGDGGKVVVWADDTTRGFGTVSARGGSSGGDGGAVEVSGKKSLVFAAKVDTQAPKGKRGTLLLDPLNITIGAVADINGDTSTGDDITNPTDLDSVLDFTGANSRITGSSLTSILYSNNVTLAASNNITVNDPVSSYGYSLTLNAGNNIALNASVSTTLATLSLIAGNQISQTGGSISADYLQVIAGGNVSLPASNNVGFIAAAVSGSGGFAFNNANSLTVDTAGSTSGVSTAGGNIDISALNTNILRPIDAGLGNVKLTANSGGISQAAGSTNVITANGLEVRIPSVTNPISLLADNQVGAIAAYALGDISFTNSKVSGLSVGTMGSTIGIKSQQESVVIDQKGAGGIAASADVSALLGSISVTSAGPVTQSAGAFKTDSYNNLSVTAVGGIDLNGPNSVGNLVATNLTSGAVNFNNTSSLGVSVNNSSSTGSVLVKASGNLGLLSPGITSGAAGTAVTLVAAGTGSYFDDAGQDIVLSAGGAPSWLIYADNLGSVGGPLASSFRFLQYGTTYPTPPIFGGSGNGFVSSHAEYVTGAALQGPVIKPYDGNINASVEYNLSNATAFVDIVDATTSALVLSRSGTAVFDNPNVGTGKLVTGSGATFNAVYGGKTIYGYTLSAPVSGLVGEITAAQLVLSSLTGSVLKTYDGNTLAHLTPSNFSLNGFAPGDGATVTQTSGIYSSKNVGTNLLVTTSLRPSDFSASGNTNLNNYILPTTISGNVGVITPKSISASGFATTSKVYDGTAIAALTGGRISAGVLPGDSVGLKGGVGLFSDKNVGTAKPVSITGLTLDGVDAANYALALPDFNGTADITPRMISVDGIAALNKVYDGTVTAILSGGDVSGLVIGDSVSIDKGVAVFADKNAGVSKPVTISGISLTGVDASNYSLSANGFVTTANIEARPLSIAGITAAGKVYDGSTAAIVSTADANYQGLVPGDLVTVNATGAFSSRGVGVGKTVLLTSVYSGADLANYAVVDQLSTTANITPKPVSIAGFSAADKVYDGTAVATLSGSTIAGLVPGDAVNVLIGSGTFGDKYVGNDKPVNISGVTLSGVDASNYMLTTTDFTGTADILPRPLVIGGITAQNKVYDGNTSANVSTSNVTYQGLLPGEVVAVSASGAFSTKDAAVGKTVVLASTYSGADLVNYAVQDQATARADITPKPLTLSPTVEDKTFDNSVVAKVREFGLSGFVAGESVGAISTSATFESATVAANKLVSITGISLVDRSGRASNYSVPGSATARATIFDSPSINVVNLVTVFLEKFEAALVDQRDRARNETEKGLDNIVVEGNICTR